MTAIVALPELPASPATANGTPLGGGESADLFSFLLGVIEATPPVAQEDLDELEESFVLAPVPVASQAALLFGLPALSGAPEVVASEGQTGLDITGSIGAAAPSAETAPPANALAFELDVTPNSEPRIPDSQSEPPPREAFSLASSELQQTQETEILGVKPTSGPQTESHSLTLPEESTEVVSEPVAETEAAAPAPRFEMEVRSGTGTRAPRTASETSPGRPVFALEEPRGTQAPPPRLVMRIDGMEHSQPSVDVVVAQRGPSLHFSVHSADRHLGAEMRASLHELTDRLQGLGFRAAPTPPADQPGPVRETSSDPAWSGERGSNGGTQDGGDKRQGRRDRNRWKVEMENQAIHTGRHT